MLTREQFRKTFDDIRHLEKREEIFNEAIEQMGELFRRDRFAFIFHLQHGAAAFAAQQQADVRPRSRIFHGVIQQNIRKPP